MQYISGRRINQDFGVPGITTNDTVINVDGRIAVGIGTSATASVDLNTLRVRDTIIDVNGLSGELGYFLTKDSEGLTWTAVSPITSNSIFVADNGNILGVSSFTGLNIISDQLIGVSTNSTNPNFADINIDPRWFRDRTPGGGGGIYTTGTVGIGSTQPRFGVVGSLTDVKLDVDGDAVFSGIISASSFVGEFDVDTLDLKVSGIATFSGTEDNILGDTNTGAVQIDGGVGIDKNVSIGQSLQVGSAVTIGGGTVNAINGNFENLQVSGFSTFKDTARFEGAVNIFDNLFVSGNISVGGTGVTLDTETIRVEGKELLIGFTTTITPNDTTANAAGIAVASTEGKVYMDLQVPGINTAPNTYKQIKWFKSGTLVGQSTDAFISNQPISIATSSISDDELLAVGDQIQFTETEVTAPTFIGNLTGTASTASFATTAFSLNGVVEADLNVATAVTATNLANAANITTGTISSDRLTGSYDINITGIASTATNIGGGQTGQILYQDAPGTTGFLTTGDLGQVLTSQGPGQEPVWGVVSGLGPNVEIETSGIITSTGGFVGNLTGTASTASFATTAFSLNGVVESDLNVATAVTATNLADAANITTGTISSDRLTGSYDIDITGTATTATNLADAANITTGTISSDRLTGSYDIDITGTATTATNIGGGQTGQISYQTAPGTTGFLTTGTVNQVLTSQGPGLAPTWQSAGSASAIEGITIEDEGVAVGSAGSITNVNFVGSGVVAIATAGGNIATVTFSIPNVDGTNGIANTATDLADGAAGSIPYQDAPNSTVFLSSPGSSNQVLLYDDGNNAPKWDKVGLGTNTTGDYVKSVVSGNGQQISVSGTGEGADVQISIANNPTLPGNVTIGNDLNVTGNVFIGGTSASLDVNEFKVKDKNVIAGFTTNTDGNEVSSDTTANGGGISIASTVGNPLVDLSVVGIDTLSTYYKRLHWYQENAFAGLGTDAWLSNYAVGIGSTQLPTGTRLAAGNVQITQNDLTVVRNINASGIITATGGFVGNLTGTASTASFATTAFNLNGVVEADLNVASATTATNLANGVAGQISYQTAPGATGFLTTGPINQVLTSQGPGLEPTWTSVGSASAIEGITIRDEGVTVGSAGSITNVNFVGSGVVATATAGGNIATVTFSIPNVDGSAGIASTARDVIGGIGSITSLTVSGVSTFSDDVDLVGNPTGIAQTSIQFHKGDGTNSDVDALRFYDSAAIDLGVGNTGNMRLRGNFGNSSFILCFGENLFIDGSSVNSTKLKLRTNDTRDGIIVNPGGGSNSGAVELYHSPAANVASNKRFETTGYGATVYGGLNVSGVTTSSGGFVGNLTGTATTATNIGGGQTGQISYQTAPGTTGFLTTGTANQVLTSQGPGQVPTWEDAGSGESISGITISDEGSTVGTAGSISNINFVGSGVVATATAGGNIATVTFSISDVDGTNGIASTARDVIGGIGSITSLTVSGVTTSSGGFVGNLTGTASTASFATTAFSLNGVVESDLNVAFAQTSGIATYTSEWIIGANGSSDYRFTGPGFDGTENDPTIYLTRGEQYKFTNNLNAHPFEIRTAINGSAYSDGIVNNGVQNGTLTWNVQMDAPDIVYYQCTSHAAMVGKIYIVNAGIASDVSVNTTGIITASSFSGNGASLTNVDADTLDSLDSTQFLRSDVADIKTSGDLTFNDNVYARFGTDADMLIYHNNANAYVSNATGSLYLTTGADNERVHIRADDGSGGITDYFRAAGSTGEARLYHYGSEKLATKEYGIDVTGRTETDNLNVSGVSTLGTVKISSGIITAVSGIVTYYGDGSNLTGITGGIDPTENTTNQVQFVPFFTGTGTTSIAGISTTKFVFDPSTSRMGIGTDTPGSTLEINVGTATSALDIQGSEGQLFSVTNNLTSGSIFSVNDVSGIPSIDVDANGTIQLAPFGATEFVGVGTTNPTSKLHVVGDVSATNFNSASDAALKTNVQVIDNPLDKVLQINGVSFNWIENNKPSMGVIAQQLEGVIPELVKGDDTTTRSVNYNGLIGLLIEVVKEQQTQIDSLNDRLSRLE